jgi:hypothetical protein
MIATLPDAYHCLLLAATSTLVLTAAKSAKSDAIVERQEVINANIQVKEGPSV